MSVSTQSGCAQEQTYAGVRSWPTAAAGHCFMAASRFGLAAFAPSPWQPRRAAPSPRRRRRRGRRSREGAPAPRPVGSRQVRHPASASAAGIDAASMARRCLAPSNNANLLSPPLTRRRGAAGRGLDRMRASVRGYRRRLARGGVERGHAGAAWCGRNTVPERSLTGTAPPRRRAEPLPGLPPPQCATGTPDPQRRRRNVIHDMNRFLRCCAAARVSSWDALRRIQPPKVSWPANGSLSEPGRATREQ